MNIDFDKYFDLRALDDADRQQMMNAITNIVLARMAVMIADHLSDNEVDQLESLSKSSDPQEIIT